MVANKVLDEFERSGRVWFRGALSDEALAVLDQVACLEGKAGARIEPDSAAIEVLAGSSGLGRLLSFFGEKLAPVRVVGFNKTRDNNWGVPWHQDRIIAVADRHEHPEFLNWSLKSAIWHCEPPVFILERMLFVRVHLDDSGTSDGAMRIALGSHKLGIVSTAKAPAVAESFSIEVCSANRGDVLVLKMLTLHSSLPSATTNTRRAVRVDYASSDLLPPPFSWR